MFKNKHIFLTTGPSVFSPEIKSMVEDFFGGIPIYVNNDKAEDLEYLSGQADTLLLAGGSDVFRGTLGQPVLHGESFSKFDILRDKRELVLINRFLKQGKPILAICRGFQLLCAHVGFHLIPDLGGNIAHSLGEIKLNLENGEFAHYIECLPKFRGKYSTGEESEMAVNSYHHQGIYFHKNNMENNGVNVVAVSDTSTNSQQNTKIIEIVESQQKRIVGCQFHPEADWMYGNQASLLILERFKEMLEGKN